MRIVSLLPSATEILFDLGLGDDVVGVTFECDFPPEARTKRIVSTSALPEGLTPAEIDVVVKERMAAGEDLYKLDTGAYPTTEDGLVALIEEPSDADGWNGPYLDAGEVPEDPWGNEYVYRSPGEENEYELLSLGSDNSTGGDGEAADVTSATR